MKYQKTDLEQLLGKAMDASVPEMPEDFRQDMLELIDRLPQEKGKTVMKKKVTVSVLLAAVLTVLAIGAIAAAIMGGRQVVEETAVPLALENDSSYQVNGTYSHEELKAFIEKAEENGITLDETSQIMQALRSGEGYWEEEAIMEVCRQAFGGNFPTWTVEEQHWFQEMMARIGYVEENTYDLPLEDEMQEEEALEKAAEFLAGQYPDVTSAELLSRNTYEIWRSFYREDDGAYWSFTFRPRSIFRPMFSVEMDGEGRVLGEYGAMPDWTEYDLEKLIDAIDDTVSQFQFRWPEEAWLTFESMKNGATDEPDDPRMKAYSAVKYVAREEGDITENETAFLSRTAAGEPDAPLRTIVMLEKGGKRIALCTIGTEDHVFVVGLDARSGECLQVHRVTADDTEMIHFVPEDVYEEAMEGQMRASDAIHLAAEAIRAESGMDLPLEDPQAFSTSAGYLNHLKAWNVDFRPVAVEYGFFFSRVYPADEHVDVLQMDLSPLTADNITSRMQNIYGSRDEWTQEIWTELGRKAKTLTAESVSGKAIQMTDYPEEDTAKLTREDAIRIAMETAGLRSAEPWTVVLIEDEPHPVWKIRLITYQGADLVLEIDSWTGEIRDRTTYKPDNYEFDDPTQLQVLHRVYNRLCLEAEGPVHLSAVAVSRMFADMMLDDPMLPLENEDVYRVQVEEDGLTVHFSAKYSNMKDYTVQLDAQGLTVSVLEEESSGEGEYREDTGNGYFDTDLVLAAQKKYGDNNLLWPLQVRADVFGAPESVPQEGEMTREEAVEKAREEVRRAMGEDALEGIDLAGAALIRAKNEVEYTRWDIYLMDDDSMMRGWRVSFVDKGSDVLGECLDIHDLNDIGNG